MTKLYIIAQNIHKALLKFGGHPEEHYDNEECIEMLRRKFIPVPQNTSPDRATMLEHLVAYNTAVISEGEYNAHSLIQNIIISLYLAGYKKPKVEEIINEHKKRLEDMNGGTQTARKRLWDSIKGEYWHKINIISLFPDFLGFYGIDDSTADLRMGFYCAFGFPEEALNDPNKGIQGAAKLYCDTKAAHGESLDNALFREKIWSGFQYDKKKVLVSLFPKEAMNDKDIHVRLLFYITFGFPEEARYSKNENLQECAEYYLKFKKANEHILKLK
jgi:hypothetical protein